MVPPNHMVVLMHSEGSVVDTLVVPIDCESAEVSPPFHPRLTVVGSDSLATGGAVEL